MYTYKFKESNDPQASVVETAEFTSRQRREVSHGPGEWSPVRLAVFRALFVFFSIQIVPWHFDFYRQVFSINWLNPHFKELLDLAIFLPELVDAPVWGGWSFLNWFIYGATSVIVAIVWGAVDKTSTNYNFLEYLLRAAVRYKVGLGLAACGFYLLFQQQMPYPSLSNLHTNYGDLFAWKLYFQTTAINPAYQSFLGFVELLAAAMILFPRFVTLGTGLVLGFLGNVAMVNLFYDVGHHIYVNFLLFASAYLFSQDVPKLWALLAKGTRAVGEKYYPAWKDLRLNTVRQSLRVGTLLFILLIGIKGFLLIGKPFKVPQQAGIPGAYGYYIPTKFVLDGKEIPYSDTDPDRWQDVIFETWSTVSFRINRPIIADISDGDGISTNDLERNYEVAGSNGRHYFHYDIDQAGNQIHLRNKNINHRQEKWDLSYSFPTDSTMVLKGVNEKQQSVYAELLRINKKYFMYEGRRNRIKL